MRFRKSICDCPYCGKPAVLTESAEVYGGRDFGMIWLCRPCSAYVGTHKNSKQHAPLGRLANAELRKWKSRAHAAFDPLWNQKMKRDQCSKFVARSAGYQWLADQLHIDLNSCHIGMFDIETCQKAEKICLSILKR